MPLHPPRARAAAPGQRPDLGLHNPTPWRTRTRTKLRAPGDSLMSRRFEIDNVVVDDGSDCYVIAEIGHNHQGDLEQCKEMFRVAKDVGANAVKLQKRHNRSMFTRDMYDSPYLNRNSYGATYGEHREALEFDQAQYRELQVYARELGITFFSTAFDIPSADFLAELDMPAFKMASGDITNTPLLRHVARLGKPMVISTGGATMDDVRRAVETVSAHHTNFCLLQCTAGYPPAWDELNLRVIEAYRREFPGVVAGLSAHDSGIAMAIAAYVLGSRVVEKHFTLNRANKGTDHAFSLERDGLRKMIRDLKRTRVALGDGVKRTFPSEQAPLYKMAKKLVVAHTLPAGHVLTEADIATKTPNDGLPPYHLDSFVGAVLKRPLAEDETLRFEDVALKAANGRDIA